MTVDRGHTESQGSPRHGPLGPEEVSESRRLAETALSAAVARNEVDPSRLPATFQFLRRVAEEAQDATTFLRDVVRMAHAQTLDPAAGAAGVSEITIKHLSKFRSLYDPTTGRIDSLRRAFILLAFREVPDGPTLILPSITGVLDTPDLWAEAEERCAEALRRPPRPGERYDPPGYGRG